MEKAACVTEEFLEWAADKGVQRPNLQWPAQFSETDRGVGAASAIGADTTVLQVPRSCMVTVSNVKSITEVAAALQAAEVLDLQDEEKLSIFVLLALLATKHPEKASAALLGWAPYVRVLPTEEDLKGLPLLWTEMDLAQLNDGSLISEVQSDKKRLQEVYSAIKGAVNQLFDGAVDLERLLRWAYAVVRSRHFLDGEMIDEDITIAIAPFADMYVCQYYPPATIITSCIGPSSWVAG